MGLSAPSDDRKCLASREEAKLGLLSLLMLIVHRATYKAAYKAAYKVAYKVCAVRLFASTHKAAHEWIYICKSINR